MMLSEILKEICYDKIYNFIDFEVMGVTADSRKCKDGFLFVCISGYRRNGADFMSDALNRGALGAITSDKRLSESNNNIIISENPRKTMAEILYSMHKKECGNLEFIGVTGTKGKTTTAYFISEFLSSSHIKNVMIGTVGIKGINGYKSENTTPDTETLWQVISEAASIGIKYVVVEVSSQAIKDFRVYKIPFSTIVFTSLGNDHIGEFEHKNFDEYIDTKRRLFTDYGARRAVINYDDCYSEFFVVPQCQTVKCGFRRDSDVKITNFTDGVMGSEFFIENTRFKISLPGEFNVINAALAAVTVREIAGIEINQIASSAEKIRPPGRFERFNIKGINVIVDYAHNESSFRAVMSLTRKLFSGKLIAVYGSVGGRSFNRRMELARVAESFCDFSVITSDNPGYEDPLKICRDILANYRDKNSAEIISDRKEAINRALTFADIGDTVLVLGRGSEQEIKSKGVAIPFSDVEYLAKLQHASLSDRI